MSEEAILGDLHMFEQVVTIRPDDTLIFKFEQYLTQEGADEIRTRIAERLPPGIHFLVLGQGIDVSVLRQEDQS